MPRGPNYSPALDVELVECATEIGVDSVVGNEQKSNDYIKRIYILLKKKTIGTALEAEVLGRNECSIKSRLQVMK